MTHTCCVFFTRRFEAQMTGTELK